MILNPSAPFPGTLKPAAAEVIWKPQPGPQTALIACPIFEVFFGGARGGGKTEASLGDWLQHSALYGEAAIGLFVRRKLTQLTEVIARAKSIFLKLGAKYQEQSKTFTMPGGARLRFAYLERDSDAEEYQGHSYTRVYVEEVTNFPSASPINLLRATLRSAAGVPCGMRLTGNPGGPGHLWVKARYIDPDPKGYSVITEEEVLTIDGVERRVSLDRVFIPSKLGDNRLLIENDPTYVIRLRQSGSAALVKAWLEGDWSMIDGAFFDEWGPQHILESHIWLPRIPIAARRFRAFDWGSAKPFSCGWYAISDGTWGLPRDALLKYREWYGADGPNKGLKLAATAVAEGIRELEKHERIQYGVADPSIFIQDGGPSIAEMMASRGCLWRRADNKRIVGAEQVHIRLRGLDGTATTPMLYFLDCCEDSIRTIPVLQHDEKQAEDIDTDAEDHAYDETRYACMSRPWQPRAQGPAPAPALPKLPSDFTFDAMLARARAQRLARERRD